MPLPHPFPPEANLTVTIDAFSSPADLQMLVDKANSVFDNKAHATISNRHARISINNSKGEGSLPEIQTTIEEMEIEDADVVFSDGQSSYHLVFQQGELMSAYLPDKLVTC